MESKFIVFFRHQRVREAIEKKLVTMKVKYICIAGGVASGMRAVCLSLIYMYRLVMQCFRVLITMWAIQQVTCTGIFLVYTRQQVCILME